MRSASNRRLFRVCSAVLLLMALSAWALTDARTARLAKNTLLLTAAVVGLSVPIGSILAFILARTDLPARRTATALFAGFLFLPLFVQAGAWQAALGIDGWATALLGGAPIVDGWRGAIWVHTFAALPWVVLMVGAATRLVEAELEELALLDGGLWRTALRVTLRRSLAAIGVAALWVALVTAGEMSVTDFFQVRTFAEELYTAFALGDIQPLGRGPYSTPYNPESGILGPAGVWAGIVVTGGMLTAALLLVAGLMPMTRRGSPRASRVFELGRWRWIAAIAALLIVGASTVVPLASLAWKAGVEVVDAPEGRARRWSARKCVSMAALNPRFDGKSLRFRHQREIVMSFDIGCAASTMAVLLALPIAWFSRRGRWRAWTGLASVAWLLAIPGPLVGLAIIAVMNRPAIPALIELYDRSITAPVLGCLTHALPLATLVLWAAFRSLPDDVIEAAELEGAGLWQTWWFLVLPLRWPAILLAWLVSFVWSIGELDASVLVAPPGVEPLANRIFGLLHFGAQDQVAGLCLALYLAVQTAALVAWLLLASLRRRICAAAPRPP